MGQCSSSPDQSWATASCGPTIVELRGPVRIARSTNASQASGVALTGTMLAPTWHIEASRSPSKQPHISPPSQRGSSWVIRVR